ncbi:MAG: Lrp/AsnC family transcriptional regulator [Pseudomonadota bacterium]
MSPYKLDRIDINILCQLQKDGRVSNVDLAKLVHLSPSPCLMRVKKLQEAGYISGYSAEVDLKLLGEYLTVFTEVTLKNHRQIDFARAQEAFNKLDNCVECHLISGGYDYLLKFITCGVVEYQELMERLLNSNAGIDKYFSYVVLKSPFVKSHLPLDRLFPDHVSSA